MTDAALSTNVLNIQLHSKGALSPDNSKSNVLTPSPGKDDILSHGEDKARKAANKFEALLIHNMLKSMRKTTMAENKSNARGIYDDMLDEKIADVMIESGGLGVADQIVSQIMEQQGRQINTEDPENNTDRLRALYSQIDGSVTAQTQIETSGNRNSEVKTATPSINLKLANSLWGGVERSGLTEEQKHFLAPLLPHAVRNAEKLGTSPAAILAIAALETGWGRSTIKQENGEESYNYFGIKASDSDTQFATIWTTEYLGGTAQKLEANFKTFSNPAEAVDGFASFIRSNPRYSETLNRASNPERFLKELQNAGYATDPRYATKAISIMRQISGAKLPL